MADRKKDRSEPLIEWIVGVLGAAAFLGMVGVLTWNGLRNDDAPPDVALTVERIVDGDGGYVVEFSALNRGDVTAAGLLVAAELRTAEGLAERHEVTLDYLPPNSERVGGFIFEHDPNEGELRLAAESYVDP